MYVFSIDNPFKGSQSLSNMRPKVTAWSYLHSGVLGTTVQVTAVLMTPLIMSQRCQWLRCACHSGVNDTDVQCGAKSDFLIKNSVLNYSQIYLMHGLEPFRIWLRIRVDNRHCWLHSDVNDPAVPVTAVSMTQLFPSQECHWHCCATNFVEYLREFEAIFEKALTRVTGAQGKLFDEKNRGRKSHVRVPFIFFEICVKFCIFWFP
jgi:hypothetical protein